MVKIEEHKEHQTSSNNPKYNETIVINKRKLWKGIAIVFGVLVVLSIFTGGFGSRSSRLSGRVLDMNILVDDDAFLGSDDAPVIIVEFSDFQCPFCRKFWTETLPQIKSQYIDTGKVKFVYRDFPLSFHAGAQPAAEASECARNLYGEEAFWELHDKIFEEQNKQGPGTIQFTGDDVRRWAKEVGYNVDNCLAAGTFRREVQKDFVDGQRAGVEGTPGFIINGKLVSGAQPFNNFKQIIEEYLS